AALALL
nr:Chain A, AALALL SEGMENT FROM THE NUCLEOPROTEIN OF SARS-COV-2,RESIDUES 217-222 [Severe acute respiratory syndrome coronavirus 2]7LTU_B Chain B, AALALL SEGMENT FROM THE NUCLEOPROTEIN OF SARS-COV-2,RESIDUES 217-222 [Severe acute respiratory syndrome coronavirus 2]7LUX_A Chain A, Nucleoprotein AALALL [Severe acute respiratory syndrome coronavirus 2]